MLRLFLVIFVSFSTFQSFAQKDTSKTKNEAIDLYKNACNLIDSSKYKEAVISLKKAIKIKPDFTEAYNKMALAKLKMQDYKGAEKDIRSALKIMPDNFESQKTMGILYYETKKMKEAKATLDSALKLGDDAELHYYQARLMFDGKAYKIALDACVRALDLNPKYLEVLFLKGEIRFAMKDYTYCINELTEAIKLMPATNPNYNAYKLRAKARFEITDYKNAINDWNVYLEAFPDDEGALVSRGTCKIETLDNTGAIVDFDAAIKLNPKNPVSYNYRGVAKGESKQFVEALKDFDYSIKLKYDYAGAFVNRAAIKFASKDKRGACDDLNKADSLGDEMAVQLIETYCKH
jgi:tetratricopeptide (TPR) repeat protein